MRTRILSILLLILILSACNMQPQAPPPASAPSTASPTTASMDGMDIISSASATATIGNNMGGMNIAGGDDSMGGATNGMSTPHMEIGPHMHMTAPRTPTSADRARLDQLEQTARTSLSRYNDYKLAERDGFKQFLPNVPQQIYHFTNYSNAAAEAFRFDPVRPTSLLYKKVGGGYQLVGVMYTAPNHFSEDQLDARVPLSLAPWHQHVNLCMPPKGQEGKMFVTNPQFGLNGSIATKAACNVAGGTFYPIIFNWMVHIYPFGAAGN